MLLTDLALEKTGWPCTTHTVTWSKKSSQSALQEQASQQAANAEQ